MPLYQFEPKSPIRKFIFINIYLEINKYKKQV